MITPNSKIRLLKAPFEMDSNNELTFSSVQNQTNYFLSLPYDEMDEATYQRKEERIRYDKGFDELTGYNYCMYQNTEYTNKWFYAFIERVEYVNDNTSYLYIRTDVFQSWMFDYIWKASFIEREHVEDDTIGKHTLSEGLETGDYIIQEVDKGNDSYSEKIYIIASTLNLESTPNPQFNKGWGQEVSGLFTGSMYWWTDNETDLQNKLSDIDSAGQGDAVYYIFAAPKFVLSAADLVQGKNHNIVSSGDVKRAPFGRIDIPDHLGGSSVDTIYYPRNNKLFTSEYAYMQFDNSAGQVININYEDVDGMLANGLEPQIYSAICPGLSIKMTFPYYKINNSISDTLTGAKFPVCSWNSDVYINWLSQQSINIVSEAALDIGAIAYGGATLNGLYIGAGIRGIFDTVKTMKTREKTPPTLKGNSNSADVLFGNEELTFKCYHYSVKKEYAQIIDNFFDQYGYKVNELKIPNLYSRPNWNYIKTINVNLIGEIPQEDMVKLRTLFNQGITLWHNPATFLDYSQNNKF